jgi:hypothetical protein
MLFWKILAMLILIKTSSCIFCNKKFTPLRRQYLKALEEGDTIFVGLDLMVGSADIKVDPKIYLESKIKIPPALFQSDDQWSSNNLVIHSELGGFSKVMYEFGSSFNLEASLALNRECTVKDVKKVFVFEAKKEKNLKPLFINSCRMTMNSDNEISSEKVLLVLNEGKIKTKSEILEEISKNFEFQRFKTIEFDNKSVCNCDDLIFYLSECYNENSADSQMILVATISVFGSIVTIALACQIFKHKGQIRKFFGRLTKKKQRRLFRRTNRVVVAVIE